MPWQDGTLTDDDVAAFFGDVDLDPARLTDATDAARAWGQSMVVSVPPEVLWSDAHRHRGGVLEGAYEYIRRADPGGMPAYEEYSSNPWTLHLDAERKLRPDPLAV